MKKVCLILILLMAVSLAACTGEQMPPSGSTGATPPGELIYSVSVLNADGECVTSGVIVKFWKDGQVAAMQPVGSDGTASKAMPAGSYSVSLDFTDPALSAHVDGGDQLLTPNQTSLTVRLLQGVLEDSMDISAYCENIDGHKDYTAHYIRTGSSFVPLTNGDRTYVLFKPDEPGVYQFTISDGSILGYFGMPHFVQQFDLSEKMDDGSFSLNVTFGMIGTGNGGSTVFVLGIDSDLNSCTVTIRRTGDPELTIEDMPWDIYEPTVLLTPFTLHDGVILQEFDLTKPASSYDLVLDPSDGFYHLGSDDGPVVYAKLAVQSDYLDSIETILETSGIGAYFFDENGNFLRKENYSDCLLQYLQHVDAQSGLYPLTDDLIYIFKQRGEYAGWWDANGANYLFRDENGDPIHGINEETAWLFLCCYGQIDPDDPCAAGHTPVSDPGKDATCTQPGLTAGAHCRVCGKILEDQNTIPAAGHSFGSWKTVTEPTEDKNGLARRTCAVCGHTEDKVLPMTGDGDPCADGHSFGEWVTVKEPTYDSIGTAQRQCSVCGHTEQKSLDKLEKPLNTPGNRVVGSAENPDEPDVFGGEEALSFSLTVEPGMYRNVHLYRVSGSVLTIESDCVYVVYNGKTYWPQNGSVRIPVTTDGPSVPAELKIGNFGCVQDVFQIRCVYPEGSAMNPKTLTLGSFITKLEMGNSQGFYYEFAAETDGVLTIRIDSVSVAANCAITLYNLDSYAYETTTDGSLSIAVKAGQTVQITISVYTETYEYPAAEVKATAVFD